MQNAITTHLPPKVAENKENNFDEIIPLKYILFWGILFGLVLNWLSTYLSISMGFVSVGVGPMASLLISKYLFKRRNIDSRKNLTLISVAFGATKASGASISLLFLIWMAQNLSIYNLAYDIPIWLLPPRSILESRQLFTTAWIVPLAVHYFLMIVPGVSGLLLGWLIRNKFIHDDEQYPFPGVIQTNTSIAVLTDQKEKGPLFWKFSFVGFLFALLTLPIIVIDLSNTSSGWIFGFFLGPVGVALFAGGLLIGNFKTSSSVSISSVIAFVLLSPILVGSQKGLDFYGFFAIAVQERYLAAIIGLMLGGLILGSIFWGIIKSLVKKNENNDDEHSEKKEKTDNKRSGSILNVVKQINVKYVLIFGIVYLLSTAFVIITGMFGDIHPLWIFLIIFWIIIIGGVANGYLVTQSDARTSSSITPPFVFDSIPVFLSGTTSIVPFLATPKSETRETAGMVRNLKLGKLNGIESRTTLIAYLSGYFAGIITTPLFALLLWYSFGIGTTQLPAPSFPVEGAILAAFANRSIASFLSINELLLFLVIGIILSIIGADIMFGLVIGLLFPPHMAIMLSLGGVVRFILDKKMGKEMAKDKISTIGSGIAVGASFVIPIMIVLALM
ncbi:MAG: OPT/YSL family transporter [Candidatus Heimdallarchaeota archaeon]|nr:OPT/YSL family transporter [Candidatus Heimdallarchaeota archaeon]